MSGEVNPNPVSGGLSSGPRYRQFAGIAEWILVAALLALFAGRGFLPAWRTLNTDFPNYYLAASLYHRGIPLDRVYEWIWFQRQKDYAGIQQPLVGFVPNPPMCVLPVLPLSSLSPLAAKRAWLILNLGFLLLALGLLHRVTKLGWRRAALISLSCIAPLRANFLFGQYYVLILLLICAAYYASCLNHRFTSGVLLSAAASLKFFPALFLILFIWKRDWRSAAGLIVGTIALTAISIAMFGTEVHRILLAEVLPRALRGELVGPYELQWNSFTPLWRHLFLFRARTEPFSASEFARTLWLDPGDYECGFVTRLSMGYAGRRLRKAEEAIGVGGFGASFAFTLFYAGFLSLLRAGVYRCGWTRRTIEN